MKNTSLKLTLAVLALTASFASAALITQYDSGVIAAAGQAPAADPEGQGWDKTDSDYDKTIRPDGWTNAGWGIERIEVNWGDGNTHNYDYFLWVMNGYGEFMHTYEFNGTTATYTITITAHDFLGAQDSFSRTVTLRAGD